MMMTLAEMLENIGYEKGMKLGMEEGMELGMEEGMELGMKEGQLEVAEKMLVAGTDPSFIEAVTGLASTEIQQLEQALNSA